MRDAIIGIMAVGIGLSFLYGALSRGKSLVRVKLLGLQVPIRALQIAISLLIAAGGIYLLMRGA
ncbi:hypothetical protein [Saccharibacillus alkalitolerans]|uniref:HIG1 domain-containing protein n=1 Tax=Saccharibacillus alkalitolerans TaxID=2705290 RepID=A0ABX0F5C1_9BACL|nr:hypothetical protein [Saccharibacillus alkalitolerans]NGZ75610.1 hypothetical protein [Saccharibacillus alkalitolerans]